MRRAQCAGEVPNENELALVPAEQICARRERKTGVTNGLKKKRSRDREIDRRMEQEEIEHLVHVLRFSHAEIAAHLQLRFPTTRGLSERSVRRFCQQHGITRRTPIGDEELDRIVGENARQVGPQFGRKTMKGLLHSQGVQVHENRVGESLKRVAPLAQRQRARVTHRLLNPVPYSADYFGQKLHLDQNEKLVMFGVTHVLAIDGYSRKVVGFFQMPVKNPVAIYNHVFLPLLKTVGIWDQVRTDNGREFDLLLFVQDMLEHLRRDRTKPAYRRTQSVHNLRAERFWVFVNQRVNYPIKSALRELEESGDCDMSDPIQKFSISWVTLQVTHVASQNLICSWNAHRIRGRRGGVPDVLAGRTSRTTPLEDVPSTDQAAALFCHSGGRLTEPACFGYDPLSAIPEAYEERQRRFAEVFDLQEVFSDILSGEVDSFFNAIHYATHLSRELS